ncbi:MAG: restriction endonuclease subunit S [Thiobacillus sp. 63-78]|uniref:restriction endonuclease subunit S n=1 Tax=Thiobacillus sp. 63-78 TaxID=1895859 RepID=UPI0009680472|nr:restriction endonuclease subunit S [Thiobacillus sp. 63-78]OJZ15651.1 MAG: restriction endonuclease subunit S [Thiobacillus sp. 63-78]
MVVAYSDYRVSDTAWAARIPAHWRTARLRYVARVCNGTTPSRDRFDYWSNGTVPWLASGQVNDYIVRKARELVTLPAVKESSLRVLPAGSVILGMVGQGKTRGMSAYLAIDATINQNLAGITPAKELDGRYLHYMLIAAYDFQRNYGRGGNQAALNCAIVGSFPTLLPPRPEQDQIVAYLRAQDAHIARFIKAKRELIKLLTEQKLRIIDHAVTRGLDPSVKLKPSGIEWLGEVPVHWELRRLKFLASNTTNQTTTKASDEIYLAMEHVQSWTGVARPLEGEVEFASTVKRFVADDVLFGKLRPYLAKVTRAKCNGVCVSEFLVLRSRKEIILPAYLEQLLRCKRAIDLINSSTAGAKMPRADWTFIGNVRLPIPCKDEQEAILDYIEIETKDLDAAIARTEEEIKLIREYRDRLIADVVTGQVDVRGWQPGPEDVVDDAALAALGDDQDDVSDEENGYGEEN